jgi:hypothetical protein
MVNHTYEDRSTRPSGEVLSEVYFLLQSAHTLLSLHQKTLQAHRAEGTISRIRTNLDIMVKQLARARQ